MRNTTQDLENGHVQAHQKASTRERLDQAKAPAGRTVGAYHPSTTMKKTSMKQRTLYSVRYYRPDHVIGTAVGHKARLVPRRVAQRIARRLRRNGLDVMIAPLAVRLTQQQADHLDRRYA